jgi:hypothetical protein
MVRGRDDHRIQVLRLVDHLAEVAEPARLGELFGGFSEMLFVHVAERGDVLARHFGDVLSAAAGDADEAEVELLVGRSRLPEPSGRANPDTGRGDKKLAPCVLRH